MLGTPCDVVPQQAPGRLARCSTSPRCSAHQNAAPVRRARVMRASASRHSVPSSSPGPRTPITFTRAARRRVVSVSAGDSPSGGETAARQEPPALDVVSWINQRVRKTIAGGDTGVLIEAGAVGLLTGSCVVLFNSTIHEVRTNEIRPSARIVHTLRACAPSGRFGVIP